jgi:hypothetical protein
LQSSLLWVQKDEGAWFDREQWWGGSSRFTPARLQQLSSLAAKQSRIMAIAIPIASAVHAGFAHFANIA